jgi:hypothetical protein
MAFATLDLLAAIVAPLRATRFGGLDQFAVKENIVWGPLYAFQSLNFHVFHLAHVIRTGL